jgi:hypothetical protein
MNGSDAPSVILLLFGVVIVIVQIAIVVTFFQTAGYVKKVADRLEQRWAPMIRSCEFCAGRIHPAARVCMHCGRDIYAWTWHGDDWWILKEQGWTRLAQGRWEPPDDRHPPPSAPAAPAAGS